MIPLGCRSFDHTQNRIPKLLGDERRFKLVLMNLVKNAVKFTVDGLITITVGYNRSSKMLIGRVTDTGVGIAKDELP